MLTDEEHSMAVVFHAGSNSFDNPMRNTDLQPIIGQLAYGTIPENLTGREDLRNARQIKGWS
jgi:hypothetical protein